MKAYLILKSFDGSQNGIQSESFVAGTTRDLSDSLVNALGVNSGYVKEASVAAAEIADAPPALAEAVLEGIANAELEPQLTDGEKLEEGELSEGGTADDRETKVITPDETKPQKPAGKKAKH